MLIFYHYFDKLSTKKMNGFLKVDMIKYNHDQIDKLLSMGIVYIVESVLKFLYAID